MCTNDKENHRTGAGFGGNKSKAQVRIVLDHANLRMLQLTLATSTITKLTILTRSHPKESDWEPEHAFLPYNS